MNETQLDAGLRFTCTQCGGRWKVKQDAKLCHGTEPCTKETNCAAISHFGNCKSIPSAERATIKRELTSTLLKAIDSLSIDSQYSPEFKNGFHRGVLDARVMVKKTLSGEREVKGEGEGEKG
jgi:hypothetical protein